MPSPPAVRETLLAAICILFFAVFPVARTTASPWTETPKKVFFIRIDFPDRPGAFVTKSELESTLPIVSQNIAEQSYGRTSIISGVSTATITMAHNSDYMAVPKIYYYGDILTGHIPEAIDQYNVQEPANVRQDLSTWDIIALVAPYYGRDGLRPGLALIGGRYIILNQNTFPTTIIHELGHCYGASHANLWNTGGLSVVGNGSSEDYGDPFDIMGDRSGESGGGAGNSLAFGTNFHFNMITKASFNWITPSQWVDANTSGSNTYRIYRFDDPGTTGTIRGLRARKGTGGQDDYYWLGYRAGVPGNPYLRNGAYMIWQDATPWPDGLERGLLDTTPGSAAGLADRLDCALAVGRTYSDFAANVHFTPVAVGGSGADSWIDVNVQIGPFPGNRPPTATLTGPTSATGGTPVQFQVNANDPDGNPLAYAWNFGDGSTAPNSASVFKSWTAGGTYAVSVTVSDMKGGTVTTNSLQVTVSSPLDHWTQRSSGTAKNLQDITTGGGRLVAVGDGASANDAGLSVASTNGINWALSENLLSPKFRAVVHDGSQFLAVSASLTRFGITNPAGVYSSSDGLDWALLSTAAQDLRDIAFGSGVYIACGNGGTILRSTDLTTWSPMAINAGPANFIGVSYGAGKFVVTGRNPNSPYNGVTLSSSDGLNWTNHSAGLPADRAIGAVQFCRDRFLAEVLYGFAQPVEISSSTDAGISFTASPVQLFPDAEGTCPAFAFGNGIYFAAGSYIYGLQSDGRTNQISTDGVVWRALGTPPAQSRRTAAAFFNNTFVTVAEGGQIWQSDPFTPPPGSFAAWLAGYFPGGSSPGADPDRDGADNLTEYANDTDPASAFEVFTPAARITNDHLEITVPKSATATDLTYRVEFSTDLTHWSTSNTQIVSQTATQLVVRTLSTTPSTATPIGFMRAVYTLQE